MREEPGIPSIGGRTQQPLAAEPLPIAEQLGELTRRLESTSRELAESEARFRDIIERNADAILVVDREGAIRFANGMAARLFATSREALLGRPFGFPLVAGETTELDLPSSGSPRVAEMRVVESEWDGRLAYIASLRDVTDRKRAEEDARRLVHEQAARTAAEESANRFKFLAECSHVLSSSLDGAALLPALARLCISGIADWVVVYGIDEHGRLERIEVAHRDPAKAETARRLRGRPLDANALPPVAEILRTHQPILSSKVTEELLASVIRDAGHFDLLCQLGVASYILVPMIARDRVLGAIALVSADPNREFDAQDLALAVDIASRAALAVDNARLYKEAQLANQTKSDFLAVISHDLRTPLNAIIGYAELMDEGIPDALPEASRQRLQRIRTSANHVLYLLKELLAYARLESGHEVPALNEIDVRAIARDVSAVMEPLASERRLPLRVNLPPEPVIVRTDPDKLRQALLNLVGNAVKYTESGQVSVDIVPEAGAGIAIRVRDTGAGIASEHLEQIFEPFWQVDPTQRTRGGGTGLGLSVVRRLVQLLGARITVESAPGEGSTFTVHLPERATPA